LSNASYLQTCLHKNSELLLGLLGDITIQQELVDRAASCLRELIQLVSKRLSLKLGQDESLEPSEELSLLNDVVLFPVEFDFTLETSTSLFSLVFKQFLIFCLF